MRLHGQFGREIDRENLEELWKFLRHGNLKRETESLLSVAQEQAWNTIAIKKIKCRSWGSYVENMWKK